MDRVLLVVGFLVFWVAMIGLIVWGWKNRQKRQSEAIGTLPTAPDDKGAVTVTACTGLYVGSTLAPSWQNRIAVGDIGYRATGTLTRFERGILLERNGESDIWMPAESLRAVRTERGLAGKVMTKDGLLVVRWELPTGTEIDTGFRADDKTVYPLWVDTTTTISDEKETA
ncbi:MAG: transporter [Rhodococcus sp. (in: high G+C Gram-positive bacteria)]